MTDGTDQTAPVVTPEDELKIFKARADLMGITYSNNIGIDALKAKINEKMNALDSETTTTATMDQIQDQVTVPATPVAPTAPVAAGLGDSASDMKPVDIPTAPVVTPVVSATVVTPVEIVGIPTITPVVEPVTPMQPERVLTLREKLYNENMYLVRCRITNMDPKKADLQGEIITVANEFLGTVKKFVPFGEVTDDGYHIPKIIYDFLDARKFLNIRTTKDRRTGQIKVESNWAKEFALEVLEPLNQQELNRLATAQTAAGSVE